jgi:DNA-binding SARP family transcriptional activator
MKRLTCREIGGVCDEVLEANTKDEMAQKATEHIEEMAETDQAHKDAYQEMSDIYEDPERHAEWQKMFDDLWENAPDA